MALADFDGFLDAFTDKERIMDTAMAAGGGLLGGALSEVSIAKIKFLREGDNNVPMLKQLGARVGLSMVFSALLGESQPALAHGYVGGAMSGFAIDLLRKFAPEALQESELKGYYPLAETFSSKTNLQALRGLDSTRTYSGEDLPALGGGGDLGRVRVRSDGPQQLAAMHSLY